MGERVVHGRESGPHELIGEFHYFELVVFFIDERQEPTLTASDPAIADPPRPDARGFKL